MIAYRDGRQIYASSRNFDKVAHDFRGVVAPHCECAATRRSYQQSDEAAIHLSSSCRPYAPRRCRCNCICRAATRVCDAPPVPPRLNARRRDDTASRIPYDGFAPRAICTPTGKKKRKLRKGSNFAAPRLVALMQIPAPPPARLSEKVRMRFQISPSSSYFILIYLLTRSLPRGAYVPHVELSV